MTILYLRQATKFALFWAAGYAFYRHNLDIGSLWLFLCLSYDTETGKL